MSPIEYGHVLLCPSVLDRIPQLVDPSNLLLALHFADESANPQLKVGYNSLGAYGTINHMHYQAYYLAHPFPVELAETRTLCEPNDADPLSPQVIPPPSVYCLSSRSLAPRDSTHHTSAGAPRLRAGKPRRFLLGRHAG